MANRTLTPDVIVQEAISLADAAGIQKLSMRKLAAALDVTAMSLYNHVKNKDDLLDLMLDRVVQVFDKPDLAGPWDEMISRRAHSMRRALKAHPWALGLLISRISLTAAMLSDINATTGCLIKSGFSYAQADWAKNAVDSFVYGYVLQEMNFPVNPDQYQDAARQFLPMISQEQYPFMHAGAVEVAEGRYDGQTDFGFGLNMVLDGLRKWKQT